MTLCESFKLKNCKKNRYVLLFTENDGPRKRGDPVNPDAGANCDDRRDKRDVKLLFAPLWMEYEVTSCDGNIQPYCCVESCKFNTGV